MKVPMTQRTVSRVLLEDHGISICPGGKGECPFCRLKYFSVKGNDSLGKCFHPPCGRFLTIERDHGHYRNGIARLLEALYQDFHEELLRLANGRKNQNAYTYLRDERGIHPQVIANAMLGAVPSGYAVASHCQPIIAEAQQVVDALRPHQRGRPTKDCERAEQRLQKLQDAQQKLIETLTHKAGWLVFFYCDASHRFVSFRLRSPYTRKFASFKPGNAGVFGRELFTPFTTTANRQWNDFLLITEGEFNVLQFQSLTIRYEEATGQALGYVHACAVGGVTVADVGTIQRVASHPVVVYDHDANEAGFELVKSIQKVMPVEACTTPGVSSDLDGFIRNYRGDSVAAWESVAALIAARQHYGRTYAGTGEEFFDYPVTGGKQKVFTPRLLGDAILARNK